VTVGVLPVEILAAELAARNLAASNRSREGTMMWSSPMAIEAPPMHRSSHTLPRSLTDSLLTLDTSPFGP